MTSSEIPARGQAAAGDAVTTAAKPASKAPAAPARPAPTQGSVAQEPSVALGEDAHGAVRAGSAFHQAMLARFQPPSPETRRFNDRIEEILRTAPPPWSFPVDEVRQMRDEGRGILPLDGPLPEGRWEGFDAEKLGAHGALGVVRVIDPESAPRGVYVHIHGGGWTFGGADQSDGRCLKIARRLGVRTVSVKYRFAPEHHWPACGDDCYAAALFALQQAEALGGVPVFIGGESAGAHLTATTLLRLGEMGHLDADSRRVAGAVFNYGCFDLRMTPSMRNWGERNLILSTPIVAWFVRNLVGENEALVNNPRVSPLLAKLRRMPPALFQVGAEDPLVDDTLFMAERWRVSGAETQLTVWPGGVHAFDMFDQPEHELPIAEAAHDTVAAFLERQLARFA